MRGIRVEPLARTIPYLVDLRVLKHLFYGLNGRTEEVLAQLLETSTSDGGAEAGYPRRELTLMDIWAAEENSFRTFASGAETTEPAGVGADM